MFEDSLVEADRVHVEFGHDGCNISISGMEKMVDKLKTMPASYQAQQFAHMKRLLDELEEYRKRLSKQVEYLKAVIIPEAFEKEGISSFTTQDGFRVTVSQVARATIPAEHRHDAYKWLQDNGFGHIITETVNAGTLSALAKSLLQGDDPDSPVAELPENLFKVNILPQVSVTKVRK